MLNTTRTRIVALAAIAAAVVAALAGAAAAGAPGGLRLDRGAYRPIPDVPGAAVTVHSRNDNRGQVVGDYGDDDTDPQGERNTFLWQKGRFERIEIPGSVADGALDINNKGEIVGVYFDSEESIRVLPILP